MRLQILKLTDQYYSIVMVELIFGPEYVSKLSRAFTYTIACTCETNLSMSIRRGLKVVVSCCSNCSLGKFIIRRTLP